MRQGTTARVQEIGVKAVVNMLDSRRFPSKNQCRWDQ
jgi:hypothetical protein